MEAFCTYSGQHCLDVCRYSGSENLYHWCRTPDRDNRRRWDYCTPTRFFHFNKTELVWVEIEGNVTGLGSVRTALYPQTECTGTLHAVMLQTFHGSHTLIMHY